MSEDRIDAAGLDAYRRQVRDWLAHNVPHGPATGADASADPSPERLQQIKALQAALYDAGYAGFTIPAAYGGQGLSLAHEQVFNEEARGYDIPTLFFGVSINILGATLAGFGTEEQKQAYLPDILRGRTRWIQLLSEPSGGSDLAGLLTSAVREGDTFVVNGQKTWSTGGHLSDYALCPVRTRWDVPKHQGISVLVLDLRSPGIDLRRIRQINGDAEFCEEFLTDVAVPVGNLIGEENGGWAVMRGFLEIEHAWVGRGGADYRNVRGDISDIVATARHRGVANDPSVRREVVSLHVDIEVQQLLAARVASGMAGGALPRAYGSLLKLGDDIVIQREAELALALAGANGVVWDPGSAAQATYAEDYLTSRRVSIAGGTTEIQRNNVSERALGLPRDIRPDRDVPFNETSHN